ncbi:helix-turn-helix domain-containing protein [Cecembia lonarensis]|uniref:Transcriptional activator FtrA n=1 Tax=Cecembia lonarensis (strain CCUG 58316 / KCTC 22772 / LW9) TaxID=1225176 RepID=K1KT30_CECL9|nr:AraC family transcriptional regulator [Cecembia lonarensis]EKB47300.1 transcriptional activator FtrA [Cecembia lonarensis LW9]
MSFYIEKFLYFPNAKHHWAILVLSCFCIGLSHAVYGFNCPELKSLESEFLPKKPEEALERLIHLQEFYQTETAYNCRVEYWFLLGKTYYFLQQYNLSSFYYQRVIDSYEDREADLDMLKKVYNNLGVNQELMRFYDKAIQNYYKSLIYEMELGDSTGIYMTKINLGLAYSRFDMMDSAYMHTQEAHRYFAGQEDWENYFLAHQNLAIIYRWKGNYDQSNLFFLEALQYYRLQEDEFNQAKQVAELFSNMLKLGKIEQASYYLNLLKSYVKSDVSPYLKGLFLEKSGSWLEHAGCFQDALEAYKEAYEAYAAIGFSVNNFYLLEKMMGIQFDLGDKEGFENNLKSYTEQQNEQIHSDIGRTISEYTSIYAQLMKENELFYENLLLDRKLSTYRWWISYLITLILLLTAFYIFRKRLGKYIFKLRESQRKINELETKIQYFEQDQLGDLYVQILEHIRQNFKNPDLSLETLTKVMGSNQTYVSRAINVHAGMGLPKLLNRERVMYAKSLLEEGRDVEEVFVEAGFSSKSSFFRYFKAFLGNTPKAYQEEFLSRKG